VESIEVQDVIDKTSLDFKPAIQFCYRVALRSFLHHNGYGLPKTSLQYVSQAWHRGYKREEIQRLLAQLRKQYHRLFVMVAAESGLRSHVLMALRYRHVVEDLESGTVPVAIRLEPRSHTGKKAAGYTFLGFGSIELLRECMEKGLVEARADARLIPRSYLVSGQPFIEPAEELDWTIKFRPVTDSGNTLRMLWMMPTLITRRR